MNQQSSIAVAAEAIVRRFRNRKHDLTRGGPSDDAT